MSHSEAFKLEKNTSSNGATAKCKHSWTTCRPVIHLHSKYGPPLSAVLLIGDVWPGVSALLKSNTGAVYPQQAGRFTPEDTADSPHGSVALPGPLASVQAHRRQRLSVAGTAAADITLTYSHFEVSSIATLPPSDPPRWQHWRYEKEPAASHISEQQWAERLPM